MSRVSPTQRTLKYLRAAGYVCQVVERWNPFAKVRQDLFGVIDIVALGASGILGVQCTSSPNVSARLSKIAASDAAKRWLECGGSLWVIGRGKTSDDFRMEVLTLDDFEESA